VKPVDLNALLEQLAAATPAPDDADRPHVQPAPAG